MNGAYAPLLHVQDVASTREDSARQPIAFTSTKSVAIPGLAVRCPEDSYQKSFHKSSHGNKYEAGGLLGYGMYDQAG